MSSKKNTMRKTGFNLRKFFMALLLSFSATFAFASCGKSAVVVGIHMSSDEVLEVPYGNFSYDGVMVTLEYDNGGSSEINLTEDMITEYEKLKFFKMGKQDVTVNYRRRFVTTMKINVVLNQFNDVYALEGYECVYDGLPHSVKLNHELPEGATITFPYGNVFSNAGIYEVTGVLSKRGYETKTLTTTLTILQAERDASGIVFKDQTVTYDGEMKTIEATNIPKSVEVEYDYRNYNTGTKINKVVNAGKYKVIAHFTDENVNYKKIPDMEAILTIEKANYDISRIEFKNAVKEYDGAEYVASITNANLLPTGISVTYKYFNEDGDPVKSNASAGKYTMQAIFSGGDEVNYNKLEPLTATLTVAKRVIKIKDKISFESKNVNFEEDTTHSILVEGELPNTVEVTYENNGQMYVGEYLIKAKFTAKNENETVDVDELTAYLIINRVRRSVKVLNDETGKYDKEFSASNIKINKPNVDVTGYNKDVFNLVSVKFYNPLNSEEVEVNDLVSGVRYEYIVIFEYIDENLRNSIILSAESAIIDYIEA